jgi:transposase
MEDERQGDSAPGTGPLPPRRTRRYTGEKLGDRIPLVQALVTNGDSFSKIAKQLKISRHSVRGIARRMQQEGIATPERVKRIRQEIGNQWAILAERSLNAIDPPKLKKSTALELTRVAAIASEKAGLTEEPFMGSLAVFYQQFNLEVSHSVCKPTIDLPPSNGQGHPAKTATE